jgi:hypothetical protein
VQIILGGSHAIDKLHAFILKHMGFPIVLVVRKMGVCFCLHPALEDEVDHLHLRVIVQLHYFSLRQVVDGQSQRVVEQQVANADALRGKILIELELCKLQ